MSTVAASTADSNDFFMGAPFLVERLVVERLAVERLAARPRTTTVNTPMATCTSVCSVASLLTPRASVPDDDASTQRPACAGDVDAGAGAVERKQRERLPGLDVEHDPSARMHHQQLRVAEHGTNRPEPGERGMAEGEDRGELMVEPSLAVLVDPSDQQQLADARHLQCASDRDLGVGGVLVDRVFVDLDLVGVGPHAAGGADAVEIADQHGRVADRLPPHGRGRCRRR